jgi:hypothetical protein
MESEAAEVDGGSPAATFVFDEAQARRLLVAAASRELRAESSATESRDPSTNFTAAAGRGRCG